MDGTAMSEANGNAAVTTENGVRAALIVDERMLRGQSAFLRHLLVGLTDEACSVRLVCPNGDSSDSMLCPTVEVIEHPLFKIPLFWRQNRAFVLAKLMKFKPTVLHCFSPSKARLTRYLAENLEIPYVLSVNSAVKKKFSRSSVSHSNCGALIAPSGSVAGHLKKVYRKYDRHIAQLNMGVFVEDFCSCFSKPNRVPSMVIAQRLENVLSFEPLLHALKHLAIDGYDFILAIIGTGRAEAKIHELVNAIGLSEKVTVVGNVRPLRPVFADADIFIQAQTNIDNSSHLLEAMSVGMVVAAAAGCGSDILIDGETAVLFESDDELNIYSCLQNLLDKREVAQGIAKEGQRYLKENHTVSKMITVLLNTYRTAQLQYKESQVEQKTEGAEKGE